MLKLLKSLAVNLHKCLPLLLAHGTFYGCLWPASILCCLITLDMSKYMSHSITSKVSIQLDSSNQGLLGAATKLTRDLERPNHHCELLHKTFKYVLFIATSPNHTPWESWNWNHNSKRLLTWSPCALKLQLNKHHTHRSTGIRSLIFGYLYYKFNYGFHYNTISVIIPIIK